jgi:putative drug exporter of the RND superfamily
LIDPPREDGPVIGRVGQWCFRHGWWVLVGWFVAVAAGVLATGPLFARLSDGGVPHDVESVAATDVISTGNDSAGTIVGIVDGVDPAANVVRDAVAAASAELSTVEGVRSVETPAADGRGLVISIVLSKMDRTERDRMVGVISDQLHALAATLPPGAGVASGVTVEVGGGPVLSLQTRQAVRQDLQRAEFSSLPVTLVVLVLVFGGIVAAGLPVLAAAVSVAAAMGVLLGFSFFTDVDQDGVTVVTLLGLGLAIDYGLLLIARYREELLAGHPPETAIARAWSTAGRTVLFSALTVAAALSGLLMFDLPTLTALGAAGVSIAVVCLLASLTFTAGMIGLLRRWIRPSRRARRAQEPTQESTVDAAARQERGAFARISRAVQRRPLLVALGTMVLLLLAGSPLLGTEVRLPGVAGVPQSIESARVAHSLTDRFKQPAGPAITVVARIDAAGLNQWAARWAADPLVAKVRPAKALPNSGVSTFAFDVTGDPQGAAVRNLVVRMRADRPGGGQSWVTGDAAVLHDLLLLIKRALPLAVGVTVLAMLVLLFAMTGSLVVPIKAMLANLVSLGATFGVLTAVFGKGFASGLLDTLTVGSLNPFVVVVIFAFAFGLSMDYEVFLLGRIKEYVDAGMETNAAVRRGLQHTGRVITSAALLMVIVFSCFAAARIGNIEQIGLGLTVAVFIDATIVRCLLVPATMTLLGRWNWWAPAPLKRLHDRFGLRETADPELPQPVRV